MAGETNPSPTAIASRIERFPQTRWSVVLDAQDDDPAALATLCKTYWFPLYGFIRRNGIGASDAEDLTQAFFERLLSKDSIKAVRRERGRLRSFLLQSLKRFIAERSRHALAQKRGGGNVLEFDALSAEERLQAETQGSLSPEVEFDRRWAREILQQANHAVRRDYEAAGKEALFKALKHNLDAQAEKRPYRMIAEETGLSEGSLRLAVFKLRQRFRRQVEDIIGDTVATADDAAEELAHLQNLFSQPLA